MRVTRAGSKLPPNFERKNVLRSVTNGECASATRRAWRSTRTTSHTMSCGFSAQSLELIAQLQQQEQRKQAEDEAAALRRAAEAPLPEVRDRQREWDWAQRYEQWQQWQAEQDRQEAKEKLEAVQQKKQDRPPMPSCDHDHSAVRATRAGPCPGAHIAR